MQMIIKVNWDSMMVVSDTHLIGWVVKFECIMLINVVQMIIKVNWNMMVVSDTQLMEWVVNFECIMLINVMQMIIKGELKPPLKAHTMSNL